VFDREGKSHNDLNEEVLRANARLEELARRGSHMYISANKWIDARTLEVEVSGHSDEAPFEEFDTRFRVTLAGVVARI